MHSPNLCVSGCHTTHPSVTEMSNILRGNPQQEPHSEHLGNPQDDLSIILPMLASAGAVDFPTQLGFQEMGSAGILRM